VTAVAFSFSRLNNFETCPKKFHATSIAKSFKEQPSAAMDYGKAVHKALELRVGRGVPLPDHLGHLEGIAYQLFNTPGLKETELQMAINESHEPVGWFDKDVYCRSIADLAINVGTKAALFDYKTGKKSGEFLQLKLTGALYFQHHPKIESIKCAFVWTKDRSVTMDVLRREQLPDVWSAIAPRVDRYQEAFAKTEFPPRPGYHCRWCPVQTCPYWESKK
jgi:hypothetical protein